jgi:hypothetical protein
MSLQSGHMPEGVNDMPTIEALCVGMGITNGAKI